MGFPDDSDSKVPACDAGDLCSIPRLGRSSGEGKATHSIILSGEFHGQRSLTGYKSMGLQRVRHNRATFTDTYRYVEQLPGYWIEN